VESGSREENASKQESRVDQHFHEVLKDSGDAVEGTSETACIHFQLRPITIP
jgi:hypothetical protein